MIDLTKTYKEVGRGKLGELFELHKNLSEVPLKSEHSLYTVFLGAKWVPLEQTLRYEAIKRNDIVEVHQKHLDYCKANNQKPVSRSAISQRLWAKVGMSLEDTIKTPHLGKGGNRRGDESVRLKHRNHVGEKPRYSAVIDRMKKWMSYEQAMENKSYRWYSVKEFIK